MTTTPRTAEPFLSRRTHTVVGQVFDQLVTIARTQAPAEFQTVLKDHGADLLMEFGLDQQVLGQIQGLSDDHGLHIDFTVYGWLQCALGEILLVTADAMQDEI